MNTFNLRHHASTVTAALALTIGLGVAAPAIASTQDRGGQARPQDRGAQNRDTNRFDDHDREQAMGWYHEHERTPPAGFRDRDRLSADMDRRLEVGMVLDRNLRGHMQSVPRELLSRLRPAPRGYRYTLVGGHLCLVDSKFEVRDIIRFR